MKSSINCIYWTGSRSVLGQDWQDNNVRMTRVSKLYYVEKGAIVVEIYGRTITAEPGDLMLIPAQTVHSFRMTEAGYAEKSWCHFSLGNVSGDFSGQFVPDPVIKVQDREYVQGLFDKLFSSHDLPVPQKELVATTAICSLVQYYFDHCEVSRRDTTANRIKKVLDYIDIHYAEKITLEQLAEIACYSTKHLSKCFYDITGLPPIRYLNIIRVERAKYLLQNTNEPIGKIMEQCGFSDAAYFSRVFKKILGYSPQAFRELVRSENIKK